jgi:transcriptional regulator with XRE-family HTH domain
MIKHPEIKIKKIRELKNYSREHMADSLDISIRAYADLENGKTKLNIDRLNDISRILDLDPIEILTFNDSTLFHPTY